MIQRVELADIHQSKVRLSQTDDVGTMAHAEVEVDDGETLRKALHQREKAWREGVDTTEGEGKQLTIDSWQLTIRLCHYTQVVVDGDIGFA